MNNINITFLQDRKTPFITRNIVLDEKTVQALLSINTRNRRGSELRSSINAEAMQSNGWCFESPQGASFIVNASMTWLLDGQTRLESIMRARNFGHPALLHIVPDDKAEDIFKTLDTGRARTSGQTMAALGIPNAVLTAAAMRILLLEVDCGGRMQYISQAQVNDAVSAIAPVVAALPITRQHVGTGAKPYAEVVAGILNAIRLDFLSVEEAARFLFDALADNGEKTSPTRQLSLLMVRIKSQGVHRMRPHEIFACTTHLAMKQAQHAEVKLLKFGNGSDGTQALIDRARVANPPITHLFDIASRMNGNG